MKTVHIKQATKTGSIECVVGGIFDGSYTTSKTRRGRVQGGGMISPTLTASNHDIYRIIDKKGNENMMNMKDYYKCGEDEELAIRALTPKEYFRLMGFDDADIDILIENGISNTQLYKMAGNSIVVDVLECLYDSLENAGFDKFSGM